MTQVPHAASAWGRSKLGLGNLLVSIAVLAALTGTSFAQDEVIEELVVTAPNYVPTTNLSATKIAIPLIETPQSISVITRDQIDVLNFQNLQQAVRYTAGVIGENFGPDERYDWLTQRGFQPVQYIDGLQAPVGSTSNVGVDLWGAESVEILKGPSGVLYGQTPPGGLVNLTMRRPRQDFSSEFQAQYGSFENKQLAADVTGSLTGSGVLAGRLTALWRERETQTDFVDSKRAFIAPSLAWNISDDTHLTLLGYHQDDELLGDGGGFLPAEGTLLPNPNGHIDVDFNAGEPDYNRFRRYQYGVGYEFDHRFNETWTIRQNAKYSRANSYSQAVFGAGLQPDLRTLNRFNFIFPEDIKQVAVDTRAEIRATTGAIEHTALVGFDYRVLDNDSDLGFGFGPTLDVFNPVYGQPNPPLFLPTDVFLRQEQEQVGAYIQDQLKIGNWRLTLSAREDWLDTRNDQAGVTVSDDAFTYRGGLNYVFDSGVAPYVAYSTSFLPVSGADFNGTPFVPSEGNQIEAGVKFEPRNLGDDVRLFASAAVYELIQEDVLTNDPVNPFFFVQTGEIEVKGVELEGITRIRERLSINGSYTYTDSEVTKSNGPDLGKQLPIVPEHKASLFMDYTFQTGALAGFGAGIGVRYQSENFGDPANMPILQSEAVTLFDALVHYDRNGWKLAINATNVEDDVYVQRCSSLTQCFYANRRTIFATVGKKW